MQQIIVSSDFYHNPEQMQILFGTLDYVKNENFLQGLMCPMKFANDDMLKQIEYTVNAPEGSLEFVPGSGSFVINQATDLPTQTVCTNMPDLTAQWTGVLCLSKAAEPHFLTFYTHKRTGWSAVPNTIEELTKENITSLADLDKFIQDENVDWQDKWAESTKIELKYNQLILFRPGMFHSYSDVYGDSQATGRMLQFFFVKAKI